MGGNFTPVCGILSRGKALSPKSKGVCVLKARFTHKISVAFRPEVAGRVEAAAEKQGVSSAEIIRQCVDNDLPKLLERERSRTRRARAKL